MRTRITLSEHIKILKQAAAGVGEAAARVSAPLSYLPVVDDMSYGADHAGSARTEHLFDPLLFESRAQPAHVQVALCHLELTLTSGSLEKVQKHQNF